MSKFVATILYRTPTACNTWTALIVARDLEHADMIARERCAKQRRVSRIDSVTIEEIGQ